MTFNASRVTTIPDHVGNDDPWIDGARVVTLRRHGQGALIGPVTVTEPSIRISQSSTPYWCDDDPAPELVAPNLIANFIVTEVEGASTISLVIANNPSMIGAFEVATQPAARGETRLGITADHVRSLIPSGPVYLAARSTIASGARIDYSAQLI